MIGKYAIWSYEFVDGDIITKRVGCADDKLGALMYIKRMVDINRKTTYKIEEVFGYDRDSFRVCKKHI